MHARLLKHLPGRAPAGSGAPGRPTGHAVGCSPRYYIRGDSAYPATKGGGAYDMAKGPYDPPNGPTVLGGGRTDGQTPGGWSAAPATARRVPTPQHLLKNRPKIYKLGYRPQRPYHDPRYSPAASQPPGRPNEASRRATPYGMAVPYSIVWLFGGFSSKKPQNQGKITIFSHMSLKSCLTPAPRFPTPPSNVNNAYLAETDG